MKVDPDPNAVHGEAARVKVRRRERDLRRDGNAVERHGAVLHTGRVLAFVRRFALSGDEAPRERKFHLARSGDNTDSDCRLLIDVHQPASGSGSEQIPSTRSFTISPFMLTSENIAAMRSPSILSKCLRSGTTTTPAMSIAPGLTTSRCSPSE